MSTEYSPGCHNEKAHTCNTCGEGGPATLYWPGADFDLCFSCLSKLYMEHVAHIDRDGELITVKRRRITEEDRDVVFRSGGGVCVACGTVENLHIDHIIPFSLGGKSNLSNLQLLCGKCNRSKGRRNLSSVAMCGT